MCLAHYWPRNWIYYFIIFCLTAIHSFVTVITSAASLIVMVLVTAICGICYCFGGSNPDYDDDYATSHVYQSTEHDQKRPILHRAASTGERNPKKIMRGTSSPVFTNQSSLRWAFVIDLSFVSEYLFLLLFCFFCYHYNYYINWLLLLLQTIFANLISHKLNNCLSRRSIQGAFSFVFYNCLPS